MVNELIVTKQSGKISFSVSLITTRYHAVYCTMSNAGDADSANKGLFYNADDYFEEASFLVVDNFMLKEGDLSKMLMNQENIYLILKDRKNTGLGCWRFECQRIAERVDKPA